MPENYRVVVPDRFITVVPVGNAVSVSHRGLTLLRTTQARLLREGDRDPVYYIPLGDVPAGLLEPNSRQYRCRWKGDARYFDVRAGETLIEGAAWCYDEAPDDVAAIRGHVAFDAVFDVAALAVDVEREDTSTV